MRQEKKSSVFSSYPMQHLTFLPKGTVCGILYMWVALWEIFQTSMYMLFIVFSFCYTLNHNLKEKKKKTVETFIFIQTTVTFFDSILNSI